MRLLGRTGPAAGRTVEVSGRTNIGTAADNELTITAEGVSRQHASVVPDGDIFWLEDRNSANGTFVNGRRTIRERLAHLDVITLGRYADLIVDMRTMAPGPAPVEQATNEIYLEAIDGVDVGGRLIIGAGELTIGRLLPSNELIERPEVSKVHARIRRSGDAVVLEDLGSSNGTFVNGARINQPMSLTDGDVVNIAQVRVFRFHTPAAPAPVDPVRDDAPRFGQEWRTRLVWSPEELAIIEAERAKLGRGTTSSAARPPVAVPEPTPTPAPDVSRVDPVQPPAPSPPPAPPTSHFKVGTLIEPPMIAQPQTLDAETVAARPLRSVRLIGTAGQFVLPAGCHEVGRQEGLGVSLPVRQVSRQHATISVTSMGATIEDRGSANGTFLNGDRITGPRPMGHGDRVAFSDLEFEVEWTCE